MERPALQRLKKDIMAGKMDMIVIYKLDRLSRSLLNFGELQQFFEKYHVAFCSVTQHIDTSTSAGKMILNILMSFSEYERLIIAERTRDKMAASKKRGMWMGGIRSLRFLCQGQETLCPPRGSSRDQTHFQTLRGDPVAEADRV